MRPPQGAGARPPSSLCGASRGAAIPRGRVCATCNLMGSAGRDQGSTKSCAACGAGAHQMALRPRWGRGDATSPLLCDNLHILPLFPIQLLRARASQPWSTGGQELPYHRHGFRHSSMGTSLIPGLPEADGRRCACGARGLCVRVSVYKANKGLLGFDGGRTLIRAVH